MKRLFFILLAGLPGFLQAQIHNDLCKEGSYPVAPYNLKNNNTGANLQNSEQSPGAGNTHWNVVVTSPQRNITVAISPDYCATTPVITKPTLRIYDDLNEQSLDFYFNQCPKPQPTLGPTTQKLKYSGQSCGNITSVNFNMPVYGGKEPNGNAYYDIQIDGNVPGAYVLAVVQENQYQVVGNDFVCDAIKLNSGEAITGTNCRATAVCDEPVGKQWKDSVQDNTRWYFFDATSTGSILTLSALSFDGQIAAYDRGPANQAFCGQGGQAHSLLKQVSSADCISGNGSEELYVKTTPGNRYKIQVDGNKSAGNYTITWLNNDILHQPDTTLKNGDTLRVHQNYPGYYSAQGNLPFGVTATQIVSGSDTAFVFKNTTGSNKDVYVFYNVGCQIADSIKVTVRNTGSGIDEHPTSNLAKLKGKMLELNSGTAINAVSIYTETGQLLRKTVAKAGEVLDLSELKGCLLIVFETDKGLFTQRFILE